MVKYKNCFCSGTSNSNGTLKRKEDPVEHLINVIKMVIIVNSDKGITGLDKKLLPKALVNSSGNLISTKQILFYVQNPVNSKILFSTYNFYQALKFAYNLCGNKRTGCCYKMLWKTSGNKKFITFNEKVDLYRFLIRNNQTSQLYRFIKIALGLLQKANVAKNMIGKNKYYPYQNFIYYNPYFKKGERNMEIRR